MLQILFMLIDFLEKIYEDMLEQKEFPVSHISKLFKSSKVSY